MTEPFYKPLNRLSRAQLEGRIAALETELAASNRTQIEYLNLLNDVRAELAECKAAIARVAQLEGYAEGIDKWKDGYTAALRRVRAALGIKEAT